MRLSTPKTRHHTLSTQHGALSTPNLAPVRSEAHAQGQLAARLHDLDRTGLVIIDELGYLPLNADAANLMFQLVSARYETGSIIITSNLDFARWGETLADPIIAAALIDRLVHHAEIIALKGDSYRTRNRRAQPATTLKTPNQ